MSPVLDVFITLLSLGRDRIKAMHQLRKEVYKYLKSKLETLAAKHGERVLETKHNTISIAMTLDRLDDPIGTRGDVEEEGAGSVESGGGERTTPLPNRARTFVGSMLFKRCVSGTRVVTGKPSQLLCFVRRRNPRNSKNEC